MENRELIFVEADVNHNKYYKMIDNGNGTWTAFWGRVGSTEQTMQYSTSVWDKKYREKLKKGYVDVSHLKVVRESRGYKNLENKEFQKFLDLLQGYSKESIVENYTVTSEQVTQKQVDRAQEILDLITKEITGKGFSTTKIDALLTELYITIPRKMKHVKDHVLNGDGDKKKAIEILKLEQDLVDNMAQQVSMNQVPEGDEEKTLEEALGIKMENVNDEEIETIKKLMGNNVNQFVKAFRIVNVKTQKEFEDRKTKSHKPWTKLLWHGSRNENWLSIISRGLLIRPSNAVYTGSMFGDGIYYANKAQKSIGYTSLSGSYWARGNAHKAFLALYEVNTGVELRVQRHEGWMSSMNARKLKEKGEYDSLYAKGGIDLRNDEFIIYDKAQCTIKYIVEISS